jgi:hypothetical protein
VGPLNLCSCHRWPKFREMNFRRIVNGLVGQLSDERETISII